MKSGSKSGPRSGAKSGAGPIEIRDEVLVGYRENPDRVEIPPGVSVIAAKVFAGKDLQEVVLRPGLKEIQVEAFRGCQGLREVVLPFGLQRLGMAAFENCTALERVFIPATLRNLDPGVFAGCVNLKTIIVAKGHPLWRCEGEIVFRKDLGDMFLVNRDAARPCEVPAEIVSIPSWFFAGSALTEIVLPDSVREIGEGAMQKCAGLTAVRFPAGLERIPPGCLAGCTSLEKVEFPYGVKEMGERALEGCTSLRSVGFPSLCPRIPARFLAGCTGLRQLAVPEGVKEIGDFAFLDSGLEEVTLPASLRVLGNRVFRHAPLKRLVLLGEMPEGARSLALTNLGITAGEDFLLAADRIPIDDMTLMTQSAALLDFAQRWKAGEEFSPSLWEDRMKAIRRRCKQLSRRPLFRELLEEDFRLALEASWKGRPVPETGPEETTEETVNREPTLADWKKIWPGVVEPGVRWEIEGYRRTDEPLEELTIPERLCDTPVTAILREAFSPRDTFLLEEEQIFLDGLKTVHIPPGVREIGERAFCGARGLERMVLPPDLEELVTGVFEGCRNLKEVVLPGALKRIGYGTFRGCAALEEIMLPERLERIDAWGFRECGSLRKVECPDSLENIGMGAFERCAELERIRFGKALTLLGPGAFRGCGKLMLVDLPPGLTVLRESVFANCSALQYVRLPRGMKRVERWAFFGCDALEIVHLPPDLEDIHPDAFPPSQTLCFVCAPGTYGEEWARQNGYDCQSFAPEG